MSIVQKMQNSKDSIFNSKVTSTPCITKNRVTLSSTEISVFNQRCPTLFHGQLVIIILIISSTSHSLLVIIVIVLQATAHFIHERLDQDDQPDETLPELAAKRTE